EVKKSDTFIHYALAATRFALDDSRLRIDEGNADRVGVIIGSGIGGLPLTGADPPPPPGRGARPGGPLFHPPPHADQGARQAPDPWGAAGPNPRPGPRLPHRPPRRGRRLPADPDRRGGRHDRGRQRVSGVAARRGWLLRHARPVDAERRPRARLPPLGRRPR